MGIASILVHADPDPAAGGRLRCAAALADRLGATVIGLGAEAIPPVDVSAGGAYAAVGLWTDTLREQVIANHAAAEQNFRAAMGARPIEWRTSWDRPTEAMAEASRAADLIVAGPSLRPFPADPCRDADVGRLVVAAGRPVLFCPPRADHLKLRSVLVAWKDTREARRAVADALPLLRSAEDVLIVEVGSNEDTVAIDAALADVAAALGRHGVVARTQSLSCNESAAESLLDRAERQGADLIVAGGYGHGRLAEIIFGGVTRALLKQERRFVLFSH